MDCQKRRATLEEAEKAANDLGKTIETALPTGWGFCLLLSSYGRHYLTTYVTNQERVSTVKILREIADQIESGAPTV